MIARDVVDDVRVACEKTGRPTTDAEVRRALDALPASERDAVRLLARGALAARPLGPDALVDIVRGVEAQVAAARELSGFYSLRAERDALAKLGSVALDADEQAFAPPDALGEAGEPLRKPVEPKARSTEAESLLTLFAYHRDAVRVAQELGIGLAALNERVESLNLRRRITRMLETTTDIDNFSPGRLKLVKGEAQPAPVVRKRGEKPAVEESAPPPVAGERDEPAARTEPVNAHGTRVYRRTERRPEPAADPSKTRREYVREPKRRAKPAAARVREPAAPEEPTAAPTVAKLPFSDLQAASGRTTLERLIGDEKANPRVLAASLAERFDGPGRAISESDLRQLLKHHELLEAFDSRERANARFLIGFHQGARSKLCNALQLAPTELGGYLERLGLVGELERTREERARLELGRKRMADRIAQVLTRAPYLDDLGILPAIDAEVRASLTALLAEHGGVADATREALGVDAKAFTKLLKRYDLATRA